MVQISNGFYFGDQFNKNIANGEQADWMYSNEEDGNMDNLALDAMSFSDQIFGNFDLNGNDKFSRSEMEQLGYSELFVEDYFNAVDVDGKGGIDKKELAALIHHVDTDQDGELSEEENYNGFKELLAKPSELKNALKTLLSETGLFGKNSDAFENEKTAFEDEDEDVEFRDPDLDTDDVERSRNEDAEDADESGDDEEDSLADILKNSFNEIMDKKNIDEEDLGFDMDEVWDTLEKELDNSSDNDKDED